MTARPITGAGLPGNRSRPLRVLFLVQNLTGDDIALVRTRGLVRRLPATYQCSVAQRAGQGMVGDARAFWRAIREFQPDIVYCQNEGLTALLPALLARCRYCVPFIIDTGDIAGLLAQKVVTSFVSKWKMILTERLTLRAAAAIVVRGTFHKKYLADRGWRNVWVVQDGIDAPARVQPRDRGLAKRLGLDGSFVVGVMGKSFWNGHYGMCYGWDLVELLGLIKSPRVRGLMIGDGDGIGRLRQRAAELGVLERIVFAGYVPYREVQTYLRLMDVALCTQTNDPVGWARTTGKLPEYLAAGCHVLATAVGEATLVLPPEMLLEYRGAGRDQDYPRRLAERVAPLVRQRKTIDEGRAPLLRSARKHFDYRSLARTLDGCLAATAGRAGK